MERRRLGGGGHGPKTFLVVDDQPVVRTIARAYLEKAGFVVSEAEDGRDALERCGSTMPDAILLDREMPNMDGDAFLAALRMTPGGGQPKVILCTSTCMPGLAGDPMGAGADGFVAKPFGEIGLMRGLRQIGLLGYDRNV